MDGRSQIAFRVLSLLGGALVYIMHYFSFHITTPMSMLYAMRATLFHTDCICVVSLLICVASLIQALLPSYYVHLACFAY